MDYRIGVIGATGFIGTPYRQEIRETRDQARITALCARRRDRLEVALAEDGAVLATDDWREVVEHPDVNLILICTPDALHHEVAMACAARGHHIVCEKPVGANAAEAREIWEAYRDSGLGHFVPLWTRYVDAMRRARDILREGRLGEVRAVIYRWHNPRPRAMPFTWRDDAALSATGTIADVGSHAYDIIRWILEDEASRVLTHARTITEPKPDIGPIDLSEAIAWGESSDNARGHERRRATTFDYADIAMEFHGGAVGSMILSHAPVLRKGLAPELELHGTDASLGIDRLSGAVTLSRPAKAMGAADLEVLATLPETGLGNRFSKHVFPALRERANGGRSDHPGLDDGWRAQIFTDAAARSARTGGWVRLAEIEEGPSAAKA